MSAEPKMVWIYATRIVAAVANLHAFWDFAVQQNPHEPVCVKASVVCRDQPIAC